MILLKHPLLLHAPIERIPRQRRQIDQALQAALKLAALCRLMRVGCRPYIRFRRSNLRGINKA